ncbi:unnamed protein product [Caenorhabditis angaria]|uniref:Uncharacterized protein n=1 Tax=Caenorhabditis angaria TaxID=860376 RepID=A0A9P1MV79_9PELO|nr:unnamed protein product [Caenorhabditis angaria]
MKTEGSTNQRVVKKLKNLCEEKKWTDEGDLSFSNNVDKYFDLLVPALKTSDIEVLSISSTKILGFEIAVKDVDDMLSTSLKIGKYDFLAKMLIQVFQFCEINDEFQLDVDYLVQEWEVGPHGFTFGVL